MRYRVNLKGINLTPFMQNPVVTLDYGSRLEDVVGKVVKLDENHAEVKFLSGKCPRYKHVLVNGASREPSCKFRASGGVQGAR
jgi:hypothetical protein